MDASSSISPSSFIHLKKTGVKIDPNTAMTKPNRVLKATAV